MKEEDTEKVKKVDGRKNNGGSPGSGAPLKYGEKTIKIHPFWCPQSKAEDLKERIKAILKEYKDEYEAKKQG